MKIECLSCLKTRRKVKLDFEIFLKIERMAELLWLSKLVEMSEGGLLFIGELNGIKRRGG